MDARHALLQRLIDHAPLFPPASLQLDEALADHRRARSSSEAWMVARFVCPASRLAELNGEDLHLSVVVEAPAGFVRACRSAGVPFKATAGLHHAVRSDGQHGFLNLLAAAVFGDEEQALAEDDPGAFGLGATFSWRDHETDPEQLEQVRRALFVSIGSCSFTEPVDELKGLGLL